VAVTTRHEPEWNTRARLERLERLDLADDHVVPRDLTDIPAQEAQRRPAAAGRRRGFVARDARELVVGGVAKWRDR
jgi:hypothetical protein